MKKNSGFTIVEIMVVVAIISIITMVAIPSYLNYKTRAKVAEGLNFAAAARTSTTDFYNATKRMPINNSEAGLAAPADYDIGALDSITVVPDPTDPTNTQKVVVSIAYGLAALGVDNKLEFYGTVADDTVVWQCRTSAVNGIDPETLPAECR